MSESSYRNAQAQAEAARRNGALSQGPVTPEGKARSSQNALTHGLSAQHAVVHPEELEIYNTFVNDLLSELQPQGALESNFFEQFIRAAWNLRRVSALEAQLFEATGYDPIFNPADPILEKKIARLYRHKSSNQRDFNRAHKELKFLQNNRLNRLQNPVLGSICPPLADMRSFTKRTQAIFAKSPNTSEVEPGLKANPFILHAREIAAELGLHPDADPQAA